MSTNLMKLHLGCYNIIHQGWINTDVTRQITIAKVPYLAQILGKVGLISRENLQRHEQGIFRQVTYLDVTKRFPFDDNTFDYVFSSHMLEHLCMDEGEFCLREVYRVMKPSAIVRLAMPDLDLIIQRYNPDQPELTLDSIFQGRTRKTHPLARHWWHYNATSLERLLSNIGFRNITRQSYKHGKCADVTIIDNRPDSLFMEAEKA